MFIAGPCVIESHEATLKLADTLAEHARRSRFRWCSKASFDKRTGRPAHRSADRDWTDGLKTLAEVKKRTGCL